MSEKNLFTLIETSKLLGLSLSTIRRWSANGKLKTVKFSKRSVRVNRATIDELMENGLLKLQVKE